MLASRANNSTGKTTIASKISNSSSSIGSKPKKNFFAYSWSMIWSRLCWVWGKGRNFLWVFSTGNSFVHIGFILLILPFTFAYISEFQKEAARINGGISILIQVWKIISNEIHDH